MESATTHTDRELMDLITQTAQGTPTKTPTAQAATASTPTAEGTPTKTPTAQASTASTPTAEGTPTKTPTAQTATSTSTTQGTPTKTPTAQASTASTPTAEGTPTKTPTAQAMTASTPTAQGTPTNTSTAQAATASIPTAEGTPTKTPTAQAATSTPTAEGMPTKTPTAQAATTSTPTAEGMPTKTPTAQAATTSTPTAEGMPTKTQTAQAATTSTPTAEGMPTKTPTTQTATSTPTVQGTPTKTPSSQAMLANTQTVTETPTEAQTSQVMPTNTTETCDNEHRNPYSDEDMANVAVGVVVNEQISAIPEVGTENEHISIVLEGSTEDEHTSVVPGVNNEKAAMPEMGIEYEQISIAGNVNDEISAVLKMGTENETMSAETEMECEKAVIFEVDMETDQASDTGTENEHISTLPGIAGTESEHISTVHDDVGTENENIVAISQAETVNLHTPVYVAETVNVETLDLSEADKIVAKPASILEDKTVNTKTSVACVNEHISVIPDMEMGTAEVHLKSENVSSLPTLVQIKPQADLTSAAYKIDVELVALLSKADTINLVHEYRTELESTKKKLERSERQLGKANDYNGVIRNMVEKLSGELHRMKHLKTRSVHVQVEKEDFLQYTTGTSSMPNWQGGDDHSSVPMDISMTDEPKENPSPVVCPPHGMEMETISIADSIKQAAQAVVQKQHANLLEDSGYVYDEHSGLYYHATSGYYYDQHKSLFYDPKSGIYYYFDYDNGKYEFHSKVELPTQPEGVDKSTVNVDIALKKKHAEPRTKKTTKKNKTRGRNSSEEQMFKNRQERRKFQLEEQSRKPRREDKYSRDGSRGKGEKGRKRRRYSDSDSCSSGDDRGGSSSQHGRNIKSSLPHGKGHRSLSTHGRDKFRKKSGETKYRSRSRDGHKYRNRKDSRTSESESGDSDVQIIEPQCAESTNINDQIKGRKSLDKRDKKTKVLSKVGGIRRSKNDANEQILDGTDAVGHSDRGNPLKSRSETHNESKAKSVIIIDNDDVYELESETDLMIIEDGTSEDEADIIDTERKGEQKEEKDKSNADSENENKTETEIEAELEVRQKKDIYKSSKQLQRRSRSRKSRKHHHKRKSEDRVVEAKDDEPNSDTGSEIESGELSDSNKEQSCDSESDGRYSSESSTEDMNVVDLVEIDEQEVAETYPPCIRVMAVESDCLVVGTIFIVTCTGAKIGRENCDICIPDLNVSKLHAEIRYNEGSRQYEMFDLASQNGTFLNNQRLSPAKIASEAVTIGHADHMLVGGTDLLCHIHPGSDTCDECEPGVVIATHKAQQQQTEIKVLSKEERILQKRQEMNQIKKKYGLKNSAYEDNKEVFTNPNYTDKAEERRQTVGSDVPGQKQEAPASVHRPLSTGNVGHKMLQKMGWKEGDTLGKNNSGIQEPISVTLRASRTAGLGSASAGKFSADDANTVDMKKASRRIQAQQRYKQIETKKSESSPDNTNKQWTQGDTEYT